MRNLKTYNQLFESIKQLKTHFFEDSKFNNTLEYIQNNNPNIKDITETPLIIDIIKNHSFTIELFQEFIDNGVDLNITDKYNRSPLIKISEILNPDLSIIKLFIDNGADWNIIDTSKNDFLDMLSKIPKQIIIDEYPEKYDKYLMINNLNNFGI